MKPPMYFTLTNRLNGIGEYWPISLEDSMKKALQIREYLVKKSEFMTHNKKEWLSFYKRKP